MPTAQLKPGHVQPIWAGHPWVYAQAIQRTSGGATAGGEISVVDPRGNVLGRGFYSPKSAIPIRILVRDEATKLDRAFFHARISRAIAFRRDLGLPSSETTGYRLVHAEGDGLPGLIVDRFGDTLAVQLLTLGMKEREAVVLDVLNELLSPTTILDRTPDKIADAEGFPKVDEASRTLRGATIDALRFRERGFAYEIPVELGQKTGYYFDQRELRGRIEALARGKRVLDTYSYVGSIAMAAARGGATSVVSVDENALALEVGASCAKENGVADRITYLRRDARKALEEAGASEPYDLVVVDPPRLAPTKASRDGALGAYAKLAELGCRATKPGGTLVLCSCSAAADLPSLTRALAMGALRANTQAFVWERDFQAACHPVHAAFPEGLYLKALVARIEPR